MFHCSSGKRNKCTAKDISFSYSPCYLASPSFLETRLSTRKVAGPAALRNTRRISRSDSIAFDDGTVVVFGIRMRGNIIVKKLFILTSLILFRSFRNFSSLPGASRWLPQQTTPGSLTTVPSFYDLKTNRCHDDHNYQHRGYNVFC